MTAVATSEAGHLAPFDRTSRAYQRRWWILFVLCFSLLIIVVDNSILNVALPDLQESLHASNSQLQWMVDAYTLVFAGLLLTAGTLGDKFGRRGALQFGMAVFGVGSVLSALAGSANHLILTRGIMGIGGAFIMPATLSIITNTFPPEERGRAISFWAAVAGIGFALGPISGGLLLRQAVTKAVTSAALAAGLDPTGLGTHAGRSTAITVLYTEEGLDLADVARHVGHANPATTAGYVRHLGRRPQATADAARRLLDPGRLEAH